MHIAIIGCGQLSRMLALAGIPSGLKFSFINDGAQHDTSCVDGLGTVVEWQSGDLFSSLYTALGHPDIVTAEKEQLDISLLIGLQQHCTVHPNPEAFAICQDRYKEKQLLDTLQIPCARYTYGEPLDVSIEQLSLPIVVKSCRDGYDGKNQSVLKTQQDVETLKHTFTHQKTNIQDYIAEQWIPFDKEISLVSVRAENGEILHYPLTENRHINGILRQSIAPAPDISSELVTRAQAYLASIANELDYVGVIAMECFVMGDKLLVNELAPRVHNSGHWTQSGSLTCQFENHLRAITGAALGSTTHHGLTGMVNLIGTSKPDINQLSSNSKLHWYDKTVRPGRKLGHINFHEQNAEQLLTVMTRVTETTEVAIL
ncbi:MAG: 5-(carboxyamino)imidazole ribonucleotide synthase [Oceanicoccus sp.]